MLQNWVAMNPQAPLASPHAMQSVLAAVIELEVPAMMKSATIQAAMTLAREGRFRSVTAPHVCARIPALQDKHARIRVKTP